MTVLTPLDYLQEQYTLAMQQVGLGRLESALTDHEQQQLAVVLRYSEQAKAVLTVLMTSLVYKHFNPHQDIRNHQVGIQGGYSGRSFDSKFITPFMKACKFPAMAESGWLTRALEQKVPYNRDYPGAISPKELKPVFLAILDNIEAGVPVEPYLNYLLQGLIVKRNQQRIQLAKPTALSIDAILNVLQAHFNSHYQAEGASRLPVLAIYAAYQCLIDETKRFENKRLLAMESHTSSDKRSGRIGDIEIIDEKNRVFEAVEVKYAIPITLQKVQDAYTKFQTTPVSRYYILSTANISPTEKIKMDEEVQRIKNVHGCQVIVNGIMQTLHYYLRLLNDTYDFIENYVQLLEDDTALKFEHKSQWNKLIGEMK